MGTFDWIKIILNFHFSKNSWRFRPNKKPFQNQNWKGFLLVDLLYFFSITKGAGVAHLWMGFRSTI